MNEPQSPADPSDPTPIFWLGLMSHYAGVPSVVELERLDYEGKVKVYDFPKSLTDGNLGFVAAQSAQVKPEGARPTTYDLANYTASGVRPPG